MQATADQEHLPFNTVALKQLNQFYAVTIEPVIAFASNKVEMGKKSSTSTILMS